ncbi:MAG: HAMP domain-containing sensor histidine kinase [Cyanobacteria bacterium J06621_11]
MNIRSVSTRLGLILLGLTLGSLLGTALVLDWSLQRFFVQGAQTKLARFSRTFSAQVSPVWDETATVQSWTDLMAKQGLLQVVVFDAEGQERLRGEDVHNSGVVELPPGLIQSALTAGMQSGLFEVPGDSTYPWWLYAAEPIYPAEVQRPPLVAPIGVTYVAMPLRQPSQFATAVRHRVITTALVVTGVSAIAALLLSRSITQPLERLQQQAIQLKKGDYEARSNIKGKDELAALSNLLNELAIRLAKTLRSLKEQETSRRELVANVSHDLRTPLASLKIELEAMLDGVVVGRQAEEYLRRASRETDFLTQLVEQLLFLAQADAGALEVELRAVSAVAIAQECLSRIEPTAAQLGIRLYLKAEDNLSAVWVDPALIGQVVLNLLDNAVKYAPSEEGIYLAVRSPITFKDGRYIPLEVRDYGPGMDSNILEKVTERFYRASSARPKGSFGLGLAIARQICQMQNARLQIESQLNQGTTVRLLLPIQSV